ncbi:D-Ala-D-Ala carboxypeptidase family metallohydrolase [Mesorhizobium sp. VNQ89]|uniref:YcbK family protein n=1 Tax=Mesorhizobium quangtriensis TaxID=3157709 RepID=UPI0032B7C8F1
MQLAQSTEAGAPVAALDAEAVGAAAGKADSAGKSIKTAASEAKSGEASTAEEPAAEVQQTASAKEATAPEAAAQSGSDAPAHVTPTTSPTGQILENGGPILTAGTMPDVIEPKKKSFLSSFFGSTPAEAAPEAATAAREPKPKPVITLPDPNETKRKEEAAVRLASLGATDDGVDGGNDFTLPGVRTTNLFEIKRKSGIDDDSDIDVYEDIGRYEVASAAGMARLAPNGLLKQRETVDTACLKPKLVRMLKEVERHFGKRLIVTSGYRSPAYNKKVRGAEKSQHMYCAAVDVQMPGVHKFELARYVRGMPGRGGVGTYCHSSIHIDIGPERDWNWKCKGAKT